MSHSVALVNIGSDQVRFRGGAVVVDSAVEVSDWEFRAYRRTALLFRDRRYFVSEKRLLPGGSYRYMLEPWGDDLADLPGRTIVYDEGYAARRDAERRDAVRRDRVSAVLFWCGPLLGFLPSRLKLALNDRYAFHPVTLTLQSLFLERMALYTVGALLAIGAFTGILGQALPLAIAVEAALLLDIILRTGPAEAGEMDQPGFWEWILPSWRRRARRF